MSPRLDQDDTHDSSSEIPLNRTLLLEKTRLDTANILNQGELTKEISTTMASYLERKEITGKLTQVSVFQVERVTKERAEISQILATEKLNGCTAIAIWSQNSAQLSHFPPFMLGRHLDAILTHLTMQDQKSIENGAFIYLASSRKENESKITAYLKKHLGINSKITVRYYQQEADQDSQYLALEFKSDSGVIVHHGNTVTQIRY